MNTFISKAVHAKRPSDLMLIRQGDHETLREYIHLFNGETTQTKGSVPEVIKIVFIARLCLENLFMDLMENKPDTIPELFIKVNRWMNADDNNRQKKMAFQFDVERSS
ncbi:hypothetical protein ACLOJK_022928 [Asimina triloba]